MDRKVPFTLLALLAILGSLVPTALAQGPGGGLVTASEPTTEEMFPTQEVATDLRAGPEAVSWRYGFSSFVGTYTEITGGTQLTTSCDDESYNNNPIGFTFYYDNITYTVFSVQCNGFIAMGPTVASSYYPLSTGTTNNVISALGMDLQTNAADSEIRYEVLGTSPNRVLVVQYKNFRNYAATGDSYNFQIRLYETSNRVEIVYGPFVKNATARTPQVGLRGASNADFNNRRTVLPTYGWANSLPGIFNTDTMALDPTSLPSNGLTYDWDPIVGVILHPAEQSGSACRGSEATYNITVANTSGAPMSFTLSYTSTWPVSGPSATGVIPNEGSEVIQVSVYVPWATNYGDSDLLTVTASGGGYSDQATVQTFSALANDWQDYANMPAGREVRAPSVVYYDGKLYVIGGYGYVGGTGAARPWLSIYDIASDSWSIGADMPGARYWIDCEQLFDPNDGNKPKIYCAGGYDTAARNTLYIYDITNNSWSTGPTLPAARYNYASAKLDNKYYVIGGYTTTYEASMLVYDPATNLWSSLAPMNVARRYFHAGAIGGKIYVAGGYNPTYLSSAEVYDPVQNTWTFVSSMPTAWVNGADGVKHDRFLVIAGGHPSSITGASNGALVYDAQADTWSWLPLLDHLIFSAEGDIDGNGDFWYATGRLYEGGVWQNSPYTTKLIQCAPCEPVHDPDFSVYPSVPRQNRPATFTGSALGSPTITYEWSFGDGGYGSGQVVQHTYAQTGTFTVVMTATNCDGANYAVVSHPVDVVAAPMIVVSPEELESTQCPDSLVTQTLSICNDGSADLVFTITEVPAMLWLSENPTSGTVPPGQCQDVTVTYDSTGLTPGTYTGTLRIDNNDILNPVVNVPVTLTVAGPPTNADFTWDPASPKANQTITFQGSADALLPAEYTWDFGDGDVGSGQTVEHVYRNWGVYTVTMFATECGTTISATHTLVILCQSLLEEHFEGTFPPAGWEVVNNGGNCVWQRNDQWSPARPNYAGGQGFCADADSDRCGSGTLMDTELWTFPLNLTGATTATLRFVAAYNDIATGGGDIADVDVSTDGGATWANLLHWDEDHSAYGPGEQVELDLSSYAGSSNTLLRFHYYTATYDWWWEVDQVYVEACIPRGCIPPDGSEFTWSPPAPLVGEEVTFTGTAGMGTGPLTYVWAFGDGEYGSGWQVAHTYASAGDYTVVMTVTNACGQAVVTHTLTVGTPPDIVVTPTSLQAEQCPDTVTTQTLSICNAGDLTLTWSLRELTQTVHLAGRRPVEKPTAYIPAAVADLAVAGEPAGTSGPSFGATWSYPQDVLWDNGPLTTHYAACAGGTQDASRLQTSLGMSMLGFGHQFVNGYRMSDDFEITDPGGWDIDTITFFAYQTGAPMNPSPITGVYLQIWD
ncbi:MAG: PKD domain-containing protein, partial [Chloroflexia bacterium]